MKIILASASPRRKELLKLLFSEFEVIPAMGEEKCEESSPEAVVCASARQKAEEVAIRLQLLENSGQSTLLISADTVVSIDGRILGKPLDTEDAKAMLQQLSGRTHQVYTGVSIYYFDGNGKRENAFHENVIHEKMFHENAVPENVFNKNAFQEKECNEKECNENTLYENTFCECTDVTFCEMTEKEICEYIATGEPMDKAGSYGIQGYAARFISGIKGDYQNVVGLPVAAIYRELCLLNRL